MTDTVLIYGHSDDLIEVEGAINAELPSNYDEPTTIEFSDGRRFTITYDAQGVWRIVCDNPDEDVEPVDYSTVEIIPQGSLESLNDYSEKALYQSWNGVEGVEVVNGE